MKVRGIIGNSSNSRVGIAHQNHDTVGYALRIFQERIMNPILKE
ncbi:hypothetical protein NIES23_31850 [Trichormus variabilis NIES-23]|uniref:Uncharacterized protein n=1 Tax=Trichormus variabilis NIES-23 TaxID=1973479 RepID=A0A1Z4KMZ3_ANAVA|nr:hypothetical protein NIES23_31850 [Trichormus variabilis NIES-23]